MQNKTKKWILMGIVTIAFLSAILFLNNIFSLVLFILWLDCIVDIKSRYDGYNNIYFLTYLLMVIIVPLTIFYIEISRNGFEININLLWPLLLVLGLSAGFLIELKNRHDKKDYKNEWKFSK